MTIKRPKSNRYRTDNPSLAPGQLSDNGRDYAQEYRDTLAHLTENWSRLLPIRLLALESRLNALARAIRYKRKVNRDVYHYRVEV